MKKLIIGLFVLVLIMFGFIWKSNNDRDARQEALAIQTEQHNKKMAQLESERQAQLKQEAQDKAAKEQRRIEYNSQVSAKQESAKKMEDEKFNAEIVGFKKYQEIQQKWMTQDNIAGSTPRIAISTPVTELRKIRDELNSTPIDGCLKEAKTKLLSAMDDDLLMYVYFMQDNATAKKQVSELKESYLNKLADALEIYGPCYKRYNGK